MPVVASVRSFVRSTGRPIVVALVAAGIALLFVGARLGVATHGEVSRFVVAGAPFSNASRVPPSLVVGEGTYDGQFFWRYAADPFDLDRAEHLGVTIDAPFRATRMGYPLLSWAASLGGVDRVPWALVLVNVAAFGALGGLGAWFARAGGRAGWWGLIVPLAPASPFVIGRDLAELVGLAFLLGGFAALRSKRWVVATVCWSAAVLTREQLAVVVAAYAAWRVWQMVATRSRPARDDAVWVVPGAVAVMWQIWVWRIMGVVPALSAGQNNVTLPFVGLVPALREWFVQRSEIFTRLSLVGIVVVAGVVIAALLVRRGVAYERLGLACATLLAVSLGGAVWDGPADLRQVAELPAMGWMILLSSDRRRTVVILATAQLVVFVILARWRALVL